MSRRENFSPVGLFFFSISFFSFASAPVLSLNLFCYDFYFASFRMSFSAFFFLFSLRR